VRLITGDGDIQTTEAFVRQVADRIQGVIESKLTSPELLMFLSYLQLTQVLTTQLLPIFLLLTQM